MIKQTGIIMSGDHPKLILDGIKTQTRRVIKPQPFMGGWNATAEHPSYGWFWKKLYQTWEGEGDFFKRLVEKCPYGQVGDRLWVRETHYIDLPLRDGVLRAIFKDGSEKFNTGEYVSEFCNVANLKWRPSIFMPRWASRITLEITDIRVERVQEITEEDCYKEGMDLSIGMMLVEPHWMTRYILRRKFKGLWNSLNAKRGYGWEVNPWVWVSSFKLVNISTTNVYKEVMLIKN